MTFANFDPQPIVISGPSGVGKGTLCRMLQEAHPKVFVTTVSHTTREYRPGEVEGESYFFVPRDKFESLIRQNAFIEYTEFNGNLYGTSKQTIIDQTAKGSIVILDIEMEGVKQLKQELLRPNPPISPRFIFIQPPSLEILEERLRGRGTEDESSIRRRLNRAKTELEYAQTGAHDIIIINRDLTKAFGELESFIFL